MSALHFIISSYPEQPEIKAACQEPAEHACIINHVRGFVSQEKKKFLLSADQREKVIKGKIISNLYTGRLYMLAITRGADGALGAVVRVCALATTGSVTGNIRRNWSPDPGSRHLERARYTSQSLLFLSPPSLSSPKTRNSLQKPDTLSQSAHAESDESRKNRNAELQRAAFSLFPRVLDDWSGEGLAFGREGKWGLALSDFSGDGWKRLKRVPKRRLSVAHRSRCGGGSDT